MLKVFILSFGLLDKYSYKRIFESKPPLNSNPSGVSAINDLEILAEKLS